MAGPSACRKSPSTAWFKTGIVTYRMTSRLCTRCAVCAVAGVVGLSVSVTAAQAGDFVRPLSSIPPDTPAAPGGIQSYAPAVFPERGSLPSWYGLPSTSGDYMVPGVLTPLRTYVPDIPQSTGIPLSVPVGSAGISPPPRVPVLLGRGLAALRQAVTSSLPTFDAPPDLSPCIAPSHDAQQTSLSSAGPLTPACQAFSGNSDAVAPEFATLRPNLEAASAAPAVGPPLFDLVLLPTAAHSLANGFASLTTLQPTADIIMPSAIPHASAPSSVPSSPFLPGLERPESTQCRACNSAHAGPSSLSALPADSHKPQREPRNKKHVAGVFEGILERSFRRNKQPSRKHNVLGAGEVQETREGQKAHSVRKEGRTREVRGTPECWKPTEQQVLRSRHNARTFGCSERKHFARCGGSAQPNGGLLEKQTFQSAQVNCLQGDELGCRKQSHGVSSTMQARRLAEDSENAGDLFSNAPEPAALNMAFFRGFGKPSLPSFFDPRKAAVAAVAVAGPGFQLTQYTSNPALPIWGAIPNYPINFSSL